MTRVVFTLTTLPSRVNHILPILKSLYNQTIKPDDIYLTVPMRSRRLGKGYDIPENVRDLCTIVTVKKDYGPITKILGALIMENDPDTIIITVDDDIIYPKNMIETFLSYHKKYPNEALGSSGLSLGGSLFKYSIKFNQKKSDYWFTMSVAKEGKKVDIIYGYAGALYVRKFFPSFKIFQKYLKCIMNDKDLFRNDDVTLSYFLNKDGIKRRLVNMPEVENVKRENALSDDTLGFFRSLQRAVEKCEETGKFKRENVNCCETFSSIVFLILILIIILIFLLILGTNTLQTTF